MEKITYTPPRVETFKNYEDFARNGRRYLFDSKSKAEWAKYQRQMTRFAFRLSPRAAATILGTAKVTALVVGTFALSFGATYLICESTGFYDWAGNKLNKVFNN